MHKHRVGAGLAIAIAGLAVAGCHSSSSSSAQPPAGVAHASGQAAIPGFTSSADAAARVAYAPIIAKCGVGTAAGQLAAAKDLGSKAGRQALWAKCGVPKQNQQDATNKALDAAEHAGLVKPGAQGKADRQQYFTVTLPQIIQQEQS
jgi:hypothetical protein